MERNIKPDEILTALLALIDDYDKAKYAYKNNGHMLWNTLRTWCMRQDDCAHAYAWLRSQPFAQMGVTIPQEVLEQLPQPEHREE